MLEEQLATLNQMLTETTLALNSIAESLNDIVAMQCNPMQTKPIEHVQDNVHVQEELVLETKEEPAPEPEQESKPNQEIEEPEEEVQYTMKDIRTAMRHLKNEKGVNAIRDILDKYGYKTVPDIEEKDFQEVYKEATK